ncbi:copper resistance system multicopper oxidase [Hyphomonas johnsonii]|uniref:Copper-binding protein n=1 Tax=Hyphomonas johnsonii MHS-2 TaxID=1280950 RepID=A0A059FCR2_9PROT|nr:copper resistance system multicopper oxidase [Hyphomonas johnsonii]KCZ88318.1 copper-binding protein [Hyphomonas johnsonii MHS-2]
MFNRRRFLRYAATGLAAAGAGIPAWARSASEGNLGIPALQGNRFDLTVGKFPVRINGRASEAIGVNGSVPAPLLRFREGEEVTLNVTNTLETDTSIHWHGLLVPFQMDGVPGVSFPGIRPGQTFSYKYAVPQNGTYWYHSHSGLQEQVGHYGPIIIDPKGADPVGYDREYVLVLGDWTFGDPDRLFAKLKKHSDSQNFQQRTVGDFLRDAEKQGLGAALDDRAMWGAMRMSPRDLADVGAPTYTYLVNGRSTADNFNMVFTPGERVRLRIINASAMTLFNVRLPSLPMTIVQADGLHVQPLEVDEFQIGVAETYDVIVTPQAAEAFAFVAESIDRSGQVVATLGPRPGMRAVIPALRPVPTLTMMDMGMDHAAMGHGSMAMDAEMPAATAPAAMDHSKMDHAAMGHAMPDPQGPAVQMVSMEAAIETGPGVANLAAMPMSRLDEPGIGLADVGHRTLTYSQLRSLDPNPDTRAPGREIVVHLTSNMERYMWSFDGVKFSEVTKAIQFHEGERVRLTLINDTMMPHPIHLHGMFFDLVIPGAEASGHLPRKHTVIVKPAERLSVDISADHVGDWAFHCHLLFHMAAGMMQVVTVMPSPAAAPLDTHQGHEMMDHSTMDHSAMNHGEMDEEDMKR